LALEGRGFNLIGAEYLDGARWNLRPCDLQHDFALPDVLQPRSLEEMHHAPG